MRIQVNNQANIPNKYIRFAKWKIRSLNRKFNSILYTEVFVKKTSETPEHYAATVRLGVPGPDIIITEDSGDLKSLMANVSEKMKRQLRKYKSKSQEVHA